MIVIKVNAIEKLNEIRGKLAVTKCIQKERGNKIKRQRCLSKIMKGDQQVNQGFCGEMVLKDKRTGCNQIVGYMRGKMKRETLVETLRCRGIISGYYFIVDIIIVY